MDLVHVIILLVIFAVFAYVAYWIITKFFKEPILTPALFIVGALLLIALLVQFFPGAANYHIWK